VSARARVFQAGAEAVHGDIPADAGIARAYQAGVQVVRDRADWVGDFARVFQQAAEVVHGQIPADSCLARVPSLAVQVVRSVAEPGPGGGGARRSVVLLGG